MNIITHDKAYSIYPRATFIERRSLVYNRSENSFEGRSKYESRGWIQLPYLEAYDYDNPFSSFARGSRRLGDRKCWTINLLPTIDSHKDYMDSNTWFLHYIKPSTEVGLSWKVFATHQWDYFTKIDIRWGFNNVRIKEGDEHKATFITNRGLFEPLVMFFGLTNSPATFQAMMNDIFRDLISAGHVIVYMDDILIFTDDITTHRLITRQVLQILLDNNLSLKLKKCVFEVEEVEYLGVIIAHGMMRMDPKKVEAVASWPTPRNKKDVQQFLGFVNFYRRFVRNFARLATPLNRLCGSSPWVWSSTEQDAFLALRKAATEGPVLSLPLDNAPFRVEADSSGYATGAVLGQLQTTTGDLSRTIPKA